MNLVQIENNQPVTSSLQVAEVFQKNHRDVLKAIDDLKEGVAENYADLFYEDTYTHPQNKQEYRQIIMTKKGWTLIAMGFTGKKATQFKLDYINAFDEMEAQLKSQLDTSNLSPELQMFNGLFQSLAKQEMATKKLESKVDNIVTIISLDSNDWRKKVNRILRNIAQKRGGYDAYREVGSESYELLELRAKCNLNIRLKNKTSNMILQGSNKTSVKKLNKLDVIADDTRLLEIYLSVVKDMAIKYQVDYSEIA